MPLAVAALAIFWGCAERDRSEQTLRPESVLTVDDKLVVHRANDSVSENAVLNTLPSSMSGEPVLTPLGAGFVLSLDWTFEGAAPNYWQIKRHSDNQDGTGQLRFHGAQTIHSGTPLSFRSPLLEKGRIHRFELNAHPAATVQGHVTYRVITIDLRGLR